MTEFDHRAVRKYLKRYQKYYPDILDWWDRIQPEIASGRRFVHRLYRPYDQKTIGVLIVDRDENKLNHLSVEEAFRGLGYGRILMQEANFIIDPRRLWTHCPKEVAVEAMKRLHLRPYTLDHRIKDEWLPKDPNEFLLIPREE